jgi:hypothetical protein
MKWTEDAENDFQELKIKNVGKRDIKEKNEKLSPGGRSPYGTVAPRNT